MRRLKRVCTRRLRGFKPMRNLLFISGNTPSMLLGAHAFEAHALICDWEDSVRDEDKSAARYVTLNHLDKHPYAKPTFVRINPLDSPYGLDDIAALKRHSHTHIVLPKADSAALKVVVERYPTVELMVIIETARGLLEAAQIAQHPNVIGLMLGAEDLALSMHVPSTLDIEPLLYARSHLVTCARAYGKIALDTPYPNFRDEAGCLSAALHAKALGFDGKAAIHPTQVALINQAFEPSAKELEWARTIVRLAEEKQSVRFSYEGNMIDTPILKRAQALLGKP